MTATNQSNRPSAAIAGRRKHYAAPRLMDFGTVGCLTQAGTGAMSEFMRNGMPSNSTMQQRP